MGGFLAALFFSTIQAGIPPQQGVPMRPSRRQPVNKHQSARLFRKAVTRTKGANMQGLARGGWRL